MTSSEKKILTNEEVRYLEALHERIKLFCPPYRLTAQDGVHQGSPISPLLFNIYLDEILRKLKRRHKLENEDIFAYADDLAFSIPYDQMESVILSLKTLSEDANMAINNKKSGILWINRRWKKSPKDSEIANIPVVESYKYLGVEIDGKGEISLYGDKIKKKASFIYIQTSSTAQNLLCKDEKIIMGMLHSTFI